MAKLTKKYSFSKAEISKDENGKYIITEISKDGSEDYDLSAVLDEMMNYAGLSISIGFDDNVDQLDDDNISADDE